MTLKHFSLGSSTRRKTHLRLTNRTSHSRLLLVFLTCSVAIEVPTMPRQGPARCESDAIVRVSATHNAHRLLPQVSRSRLAWSYANLAVTCPAEVRGHESVNITGDWANGMFGSDVLSHRRCSWGSGNRFAACAIDCVHTESILWRCEADVWTREPHAPKHINNDENFCENIDGL